MGQWKLPVATLGTFAIGVLGFICLHATVLEWLLLGPALISFVTILIIDIFRWRHEAWARGIIVLYIVLLALVHTTFIPLVLHIFHPISHTGVVAEHPYAVSILFAAVDVLCMFIPLTKVADKDVITVLKALTDSFNLIILVIALLVTQSSTGLWVLSICLGPISVALRLAEAWMVLRVNRFRNEHQVNTSGGN